MEKKENNYSVYYHYNPKSNKYYVGITKQEPERRWNNGYGYYGQAFWTAIQKYGWSNFEHIVIETGLSKEMAISLEKRLIQECDSFKNGYNCSMGGESVDGYKMPIETKEKISRANSGVNSYWFGKKRSKESIQKASKKHINHPSCSKEVNQYDLKGNYIATYPSLNEVTRQFGVGVAKALHGEIRTFHGFQWRFVSECCGNDNIDAYYRTSIKFKPVIQYDINGKRIRNYYNSNDLKDAGFKSTKSIHSICYLDGDTYGGYIWRFLRDEDVVGDKDSYYDLSVIVDKIHSDMCPSDKPIGQYDLQGNLIAHYDNCKKAAKAIGGNNKNISLVGSNKKKSAYGCIWCYDEDIDNLSRKIEFANKPLRKCKISRYTLDGEYIDTFSGAKPAVKELGFGIPSVIDACCFGMIPDAFGYIWKYAE